MKLVVEKRRSDAIDVGIIYGVIALLALAAARYLPVLDITPSCAFRQVSGIPCPTCGITRSLVFLAHGGLRSAFEMNPGFAFLFISALLYMVYNSILLLAGVRLSLSFSRRESAFGRGGIIAALLANWTYLIIRSS